MHSVKAITLLGLVMVISVGFSAMIVDEAYSQTPRYLGEHCWDSAGGFLRLGLTLMGDGHVSLCGLATSYPYDWAINGNLEVVGNELHITSTEAVTLDGGTQMVSRVGEAVLDFVTLNGTASFIAMYWDGGAPYLEHFSYDVYYVPCETDGSQDGVDKREELKRLLRMYCTASEENQD